MLKICGLALLMAVCTGTGFYMSARLVSRKKRLNSVGVFISSVSERIRTGEELCDIIAREGAAAGIFNDGYKTRLEPGGLNGRDTELINEFLSDLGMGDTVSQISRCETYAELIKRQEHEAEEEVKQKSALYGKLGLFAGLFMLIILI